MRRLCRNQGCRCPEDAEYNGFCSHECSVHESSAVLPHSCPCWHAPCVVTPDLLVADAQRHAHHGFRPDAR
jgi:hypothetical protein